MSVTFTDLSDNQRKCLLDCLYTATEDFREQAAMITAGAAAADTDDLRTLRQRIALELKRREDDARNLALLFANASTIRSYAAWRPAGVTRQESNETTAAPVAERPASETRKAYGETVAVTVTGVACIGDALTIVRRAMTLYFGVAEAAQPPSTEVPYVWSVNV